MKGVNVAPAPVCFGLQASTTTSSSEIILSVVPLMYILQFATASACTTSALNK